MQSKGVINKIKQNDGIIKEGHNEKNVAVWIVKRRVGLFHKEKAREEEQEKTVRKY